MFFANCPTVADVKREYRRLAKLHHPDRGGSCVIMQQVNAAYHARLAALNGQTSTGSDGKEHVYRYSYETEQAVMDKVSELLALNLAGIEIEIIGTWLWISGDTKPVKDRLKAAGCSWHSKRLMWYWRKFDYSRRFSGLDFDEMRRMYGSKIVDQDERMPRPAMVPVAA